MQDTPKMLIQFEGRVFLQFSCSKFLQFILKSVKAEISRLCVVLQSENE